MNVVDTSGWLEFFAGGRNAQVFARPIKAFDQLVVPAICIYELSKVILRERDEHHLIQALALVQKGKVVDLTPSLATAAAKLSLQHTLPMADSIIYATTLQCNATLWTQDADFRHLDQVNYFPK